MFLYVSQGVFLTSFLWLVRRSKSSWQWHPITHPQKFRGFFTLWKHCYFLMTTFVKPKDGLYIYLGLLSWPRFSWLKDFFIKFAIFHLHSIRLTSLAACKQQSSHLLSNINPPTHFQTETKIFLFCNKRSIRYGFRPEMKLSPPICNAWFKQ